ncbi:hypothetical protein ES332_A01G205600v1 [Gossypium tomentosum]|uniref:DUF241 domain-containing protein n=1 Tax=Gossypium tomentosum TaxID=34277 RepID=A0A5D2RVD8_GOSTO|nr:hypothetical protein ES332_A01G205600v1 [Gossypium tomentosum]
MAAQTIPRACSNSLPLPSRPNPLVSEIDEHLKRLRDSEATSTSLSISHKLNSLQDLYDCGPVDELLDGSLRLFDLCNTAKDILLQTKGSIQDIQSVMRRRGCEYLFNLFSGPKERSKYGSWALVSKLLHYKRIACEQAGRRDINEFENVDAALRSVMSQKMSKSENVDMPRQLKELELCVQELEDGLECLFRCMIKDRVSLLNAFNR